jgi:hypothetical protein
LLLPGINNLFQRGLFSENTLGFFSIVPEFRLGGDFVQLFDALAFALDVKAASAVAPGALRGGLILRGFLPAFL